MAHVMLGRLRGRGEPSETVLDRLQAINPQWRVHWQPWYDGRSYWLIGNCVGSEVLRRTGHERLNRLTALAAEDRGWLHAAHIAGCELMADGQWIVTRFTEEEFGTDWMFNELRQIDQRMTQLDAEEKAARERRRRSEEYRYATDEAKKNAALKQYLDDFELEHPGWMADQEAMLKECWGYHMRGQRHFRQPGLVTPAGAA